MSRQTPVTEQDCVLLHAALSSTLCLAPTETLEGRSCAAPGVVAPGVVAPGVVAPDIVAPGRRGPWSGRGRGRPRATALQAPSARV